MLQRYQECPRNWRWWVVIAINGSLITMNQMELGINKAISPWPQNLNPTHTVDIIMGSNEVRASISRTSLFIRFYVRTTATGGRKSNSSPSCIKRVYECGSQLNLASAEGPCPRSVQIAVGTGGLNYFCSHVPSTWWLGWVMYSEGARSWKGMQVHNEYMLVNRSLLLSMKQFYLFKGSESLN